MSGPECDNELSESRRLGPGETLTGCATFDIPEGVPFDAVELALDETAIDTPADVVRWQVR